MVSCSESDDEYFDVILALVSQQDPIRISEFQFTQTGAHKNVYISYRQVRWQALKVRAYPAWPEIFLHWIGVIKIDEPFDLAGCITCSFFRCCGGNDCLVFRAQWSTTIHRSDRPARLDETVQGPARRESTSECQLLVFHLHTTRATGSLHIRGVDYMYWSQHLVLFYNYNAIESQWRHKHYLGGYG